MEPFISIFNGRRREPGADSKEVFAQIWLEALQYLRLFKGARLHVFLAIALHADEEGWAWPSYERLADETGYSRDTVCKALADLCELEIDGERVLLRYQPRAEEAGQFKSNRYLIFPKAADLEQYDGAGVLHLAGDTGGQFGQESRVEVSPTREKPYTVNTDTNQNHYSTRHDDNDDIIMHEQENQAQEKAPEPSAEHIAVAMDAKQRADTAAAMAALMERGWNAGAANAERFVAKHGADVVLDICGHAKRRNLGAGWVRVNAQGWRPSVAANAGISSSDNGDGQSSVLCPRCSMRPCHCEEFGLVPAEELADAEAAR